MMTATGTEAALLAAIRENPGEDAPRLVYADWLADAGRELDAAMQRIIAQPGEDRWRLDYAAELERTAGGVECEKCNGTGKRKRGYCDAFMYGCDEFGDDDCSHKNEIITCGCNHGRVSDGLAELAEFVRVQVELAAEHSDCGVKGYLYCGIRCTVLHNRQRELWPAVRGAFEGDGAAKLFPVLGIGGIVGNAPLGLIRRGLPTVVRCTLAEWMGGEECRKCRGGSHLILRPDAVAPPFYGPCPDCVDGRPLGIGPRLAQRWPIERVEVTDDPLNLPSEITNRFPPGQYTLDQFRSTLSDALIAWARSQPIEEGRS